MQALFLTLYSLAIRMYFLLARLLAPFNARARDFVQGRRGQWQRMQTDLARTAHETKTAWFHFASLGEFEQGRPLMEWFKRQVPGGRLVVTFFSPSGYNLRRNYELADHVFYLPADTPANARRLLDLLNPSLVVFVKYDFWVHYIRTISRRHIPLLLISAVFRRDQPFFNPVAGAFFRRVLPAFSHVFVQDEQSLQLAKELGLQQVTLSGDTRFDRVLQTVTDAEAVDIVAQFKGDNRLLIAGSSWPEEEKMLAGWLPHMPANWKMIIAPHNVSVSHIQEIEQLFPGAMRYSAVQKGAALPAACNVLIVDGIGLLSRIYRYGDAALVGGGFGRGLHNILEAAAFGMPVMFGPENGRFWEAAALERACGGFVVARNEDFTQRMQVFCHFEYIRQHAAGAAKRFVAQRSGAVKTITSFAERAGLV